MDEKEKKKEEWREKYKIQEHFIQQKKTAHKINHLRLRYKLFIDINYKENDIIKQEDKFCPLIEQVCLGEVCSFWVDDTLGCKYGADPIVIKKKKNKKGK